MPAWLANPRRAAAYGLLLGAAAAVAAEAGRIALVGNWHAVVPGRAYRCAQLSPGRLADRARRHGVRTVINLRGCCPEFPWYAGEARATRDLDIAQEDVTLSATKLPAPDELRRLVEVIDRSEYPLLIHCRQGVDRTGLTAALILLLTTDASLAEARRQLGPRFGHVPFGPTRAMTRFFDLYEAWLRSAGLAHSREAVRRWVNGGYCPGRCRGSLQLLGPVPPLVAGEPAGLRVRARNLSPEPWPLRPGTGAGVHVRFVVFDEALAVRQIGRAGLFEAEVPPGGQIDLTLAVAPLPQPGRYTLLADLLDGQTSAFSQYGMEPVHLELHVANRD
jgi:protein tyrosine phosphatase (PTP) superfamily phosphohydrolase (DUF442 family)